MKCEFKADDFDDAMDALCNFLNGGLLPPGFYTIPEPNRERSGYWFVTKC